MKVKREKSTEQRLRCPVLFSHAWGEAPPACLGGRGDGNVKILLPETKSQGFAGVGAQREKAAGRAEKSGAQLEG